MDNKNVKICDECESEFLASLSQMSGLCPECASVLYGYENCKHIFEQGRCVKCLWNGNKSEYIRWLEKRFGWTILNADDLPDFTYDRDTGLLLG